MLDSAASYARGNSMKAYPVGVGFHGVRQILTPPPSSMNVSVLDLEAFIWTLEQNTVLLLILVFVTCIHMHLHISDKRCPPLELAPEGPRNFRPSLYKHCDPMV